MLQDTLLSYFFKKFKLRFKKKARTKQEQRLL